MATHNQNNNTPDDKNALSGHMHNNRQTSGRVRKGNPVALRRAMADVGQHLSQWRRLLNLTVDELSARSEVSPATINRIEKGKGASLENTLRLARAMGLLEDAVSGFDPWQNDRGKLLISTHIPGRAEKRPR